MKNFGILLYFLVAFSFTQAQWINQNPVPDGNNLSSVFFIDDDNGWIVGSEGLIIKTTNAGVDWIPQNSNTTNDLKAVKFVDLNNGWVVGEDGLIIKSTNGGVDWIIQNSFTTEELNSLDFFDDNIGWVVGGGGIMLKTSDGGNTWSKLTTSTTYKLNSICFVNDLTGWVAGGGDSEGIILKTTDGGNNWVEDFSVAAVQFLFVYFLDENTGWVGGDMGGMKTTDGGNTWVQVSGLYAANSIFFKDTNNGFYVGGINCLGIWIYATTDGGNTWQEKVNYIGESESINNSLVGEGNLELVSVLVTNGGKGWAVGGNGKMYTTNDDGNSWSKQLSGCNVNSEDIYSLFFVNDQVGWAFGTRSQCYQTQPGVILKTTDGGRVWKTQLTYGNYNLPSFESAYFIDELHGWSFINYAGVPYLFRTTDGGESYIDISLPEECWNTKAIFFIDQSTGWIVGDKIYKTTDGGLTFIEKNSFGGLSIFFSDECCGWVVGDNGSILKSTDGGESWIQKTSGINENLTIVKFYNSNIGMCIGSEGSILLTTDAGESWILKNGYSLQTINFVNSTTVWGYTSEGTVYKTTNSGDTWNTINTGLGFGQTAFYINENSGWVGGRNGTIFKFQNGYTIPVSLVSLTAFSQNEVVTVNWTTVTELNNNGFEIERKLRTDGNNLNLWEKIGIVVGHGTTTEPNKYVFVDRVNNSGVYQYRLKQIDNNGEFEYSKIVEVELFLDKYTVYQNYPNPFNPSTTIRYQLPKDGMVTLKIYDVLGAEVATLVSEEKTAGTYEVDFNASQLANGVYVYKIQSGDYFDSKKMTLLK